MTTTAEERVAALLRDRGAAGVDHPGGTLDDHLRRVQQRLAALGAPPVVQLAGRAHAVYGTDGFDVVLLGPGERGLLVEAAGPEVEALVHRYGGCDRDRTWPDLATTGRVWSRATGAREVLTGNDLRDFADLSLVNELDVVERAPAVREQHGDYFRRLARAWAPVLSPAVLADAERVLG
ncbi:hypothetical protein GB931_01805 [Modestobacter sp. I12A-02628]|uniref:DUF6817 domain-containing protein n=1 Tax=Goekera deserti TaxID=2497753 RepID=A0A7K3WIE4_9ACTN|nr:hypothetical protein [Goekera deserti]MPQ96673.1 hypothetical protein [Goekera deserti]NDI47015.1 hypothetical protein [Goekera deserti]NEL56251.1 hypothetical protein [Goekera deserti]